MAAEQCNLSPDAQLKIQTSEAELASKYNLPIRHRVIYVLFSLNALVYNVALLSLGIESAKVQDSTGAQACFITLAISASWDYFGVGRPFTKRRREVAEAYKRHWKLVEELKTKDKDPNVGS